jgi:arginyl-tRNA synthetase
MREALPGWEDRLKAFCEDRQGILGIFAHHPDEWWSGRLGELCARCGTMAVNEAGKQMDASGVGAEFSAEERAEVARKVGLAAVKFADLSNHRQSDYVFDLERFSQFEGKTGPYHLYAAVRMKAILRKAAERGLKPGTLSAPAGSADRQLLLVLSALPEAFAYAAETSTPHSLCEAAYGLAQTFSTFYQNCNILREEDPARQGAWLALTELSLRALEDLLSVLGLETPERM